MRDLTQAILVYHGSKLKKCTYCPIAVDRIQNIPKHLFDEGYRFVSFEVESLFTNVPLSQTINVILQRIYKDKTITTNLKKTTLKKLLSDSCTKTPFLCNGSLYQ